MRPFAVRTAETRLTLTRSGRHGWLFHVSPCIFVAETVTSTRERRGANALALSLSLCAL